MWPASSARRAAVGQALGRRVCRPSALRPLGARRSTLPACGAQGSARCAARRARRGRDAAEQPAEASRNPTTTARPIAPRRPRRNASPVDCAARLTIRAPCTTSPIATACCTPRRSISQASREAVGTPFYCYSTATLERHYRVFAGAFADVPSLVCYAMKANSNQAVIATLAQARRRRRRGVGRRAEARARRRRAAATRSCSPASARPRRELALAVDAGILCVNVESEPELELLSAIAAAKGRTARRLGARQSRRRRQDPRQDRDRQVREQVRHPDQPRARGLCAAPPSCRACASPASTCISAARSPSSTPFDDAFALLSDFVRDAARRRPHHRACRSRRRPRHSLSRRQRAAARSGRLCRRWSSARRAASTAS